MMDLCSRICEHTLSKWLGDFSVLIDARLWVSVFLPADRVHDVAGLARGHDNAEVVACGREIVAGLVTQGNLVKHSY